MVRQLIDEQNFSFVGTFPLQTSDIRHVKYDVTVTKEEINGILPFYGHKVERYAYNKDANLFISTDFDYEVATTKKGGWDIYIKAKIWERIYDLHLQISSSGAASLTLNDPVGFRMSLTLTGYIDKIKPLSIITQI